MKKLRLLLALALLPVGGTAAPVSRQAEKPNFLWIIAEDMGPWLGCYGERSVKTPHIDALASKGVRFTQAWAGGPACSPSRSSLFTGMYSTALGTDTHREERPVPGWAFFTQYLRGGGYYCSNTDKTDYNIAKLGADYWDENNNPRATYATRAPGQPFFHCVSSLMETHMSWIVDHPPATRTLRTILPEAMCLPAYLPDEPLLRDDRAWHLEGVQRMDQRVGKILADLKTSGEENNTIVFFFSDHGGCLPNGKGYASDRGFHVPLVVYVPEKFAHLLPSDMKPGATCDRLVSFLDFAPTVLGLADVSAPRYLQGVAFAGTQASATPRDALYGYRGFSGGPFGGRWDVVRTVRDARYLYTRNFLPFRAAGLRQDYHFRMPGQQAWEAAWRAGRCDATQSRFWESKPIEELYDLQSDPEQSRNLAMDPAQGERLALLRGRLYSWLETTGDIGFTPNPLRTSGAFPSYYDRMQAAPDLRRAILEQAWLASSPKLGRPEQLASGLRSPHSELRYWAACGLVRLAYARPAPPLAAAAQALLDDPEAWVRVAAAEAAVASGAVKEGLDVLWREIETRSIADTEAFAAIETLGPRAAPLDSRLADRHGRDPANFRLNSALVTRGLLSADQLFTGIQ